MSKIHLKAQITGAVCGRHPARTIDDVRRVTCLMCMKTPAYVEAKAASDAARKAAFDAQEPRTVAEPWHTPYGSVMMECKSCGNDKFREADRTCYGHYDNWVCAACGNTESRLTETGMSF